MWEMRSNTQGLKTVRTIPMHRGCRHKQHMLHASKSIVGFQEPVEKLGASIDSDRIRCATQSSETNCFDLS